MDNTGDQGKQSDSTFTELKDELLSISVTEVAETEEKAVRQMLVKLWHRFIAKDSQQGFHFCKRVHTTFLSILIILPIF